MEIGKRTKVYILALSIRLFLLAFTGEDWDTYVFITVARQFITRGIDPYSVAAETPPYVYIPYVPFTPNWYAYPPLPLFIFSAFYFIYLLLGVSSNLLERFFIKLPLALNDIVLGYLSYKLVMELSKDKLKAEKVEFIILLNPYFIIISSVWGQFDAVALTFFLISLLFAIRERLFISSVFFGLGLLTKQTVAFLLPFLLVFIFRKKGLGEAIKFTFSVALLFLLVSAPFLIVSPVGYLGQLLFFHLGRPPHGYNLFFVVYYLPQVFASYIGLSEFQRNALEIILNNLVSALSFAALFAGIIHIAMRQLGNNYDLNEEKGLIYASMLGSIAFLLFSKVTNEQYFAYAIGLMFIFSIVNDSEKIYKVSFYLSIYLSLSILIAGMRFVMFISPAILVAIFGRKMAEMLWGLSPLQGDFVPAIAASVFIAIVISLPTLLGMAKILIRELKIPFDIKSVKEQLSKLKLKLITKPLNKIVGYFQFRKISVIFLVLILTLDVLSGNFAMPTEEDSVFTNFSKNQKIVGVMYFWWNNPYHDPSKKGGDWIGTELTPLEGYYESKYPYLRKDIEQIKRAGIDFIVLDYYPGCELKVDLLADIAEEYGLAFTFLLNISKLTLDPTYINFAPQTYNGTHLAGYYALEEHGSVGFVYEQLANTLYFSTYSNFLRIENKPIIFLTGVSNVMPGWSISEKGYLANMIVEMIMNEDSINETEAYMKISSIVNSTVSNIYDLMTYYPEDLNAFLSGTTPLGEYWINAYKYGWIKFWNVILDLLYNSEIGKNASIVVEISQDPLNLLNISALKEQFQSEFISNPRSMKLRSIDSYLNELRSTVNESLKEGGLGVGTIMPSFISGEYNFYMKMGKEYLYDVLWRNITQMEVTIVLIYAWNDYYTSAVIEPTIEFGTTLLDKTKINIENFKSNT
ncbi:MAG: glycosyltransferase 87 family protein [Candidatus Njordarchaeia archaeon]